MTGTARGTNRGLPRGAGSGIAVGPVQIPGPVSRQPQAHRDRNRRQTMGTTMGVDAGATVARALGAFGLPDDPEVASPADVCLLVEGTYPFVSGGVSSWVHDIILGHPELSFAVLNVGSYPGAHGELRFKLPPNVVGLHRVYCQEAAPPPLDGAGRAELQRADPGVAGDRRRPRHPVARARALRRLHLEGPGAGDAAYDEILTDLATNDLTLPELLHGHASFDLLDRDRRSGGAGRAVPRFVLALPRDARAGAAPADGAPVPKARCYHAVATGYAGLLGRGLEPAHRAAAGRHRARHLRARARDGAGARRLDSRRGEGDQLGGVAATWAPRISPLRRLWSRFFRTLSRLAYARGRRHRDALAR